MSVSIWPSMYGETPLQHYNSCFSIAHMQEHSDICLNFQNDCILKNLNKVNLVNETEATTSMTAQDKIADLNEGDNHASKGVISMRNLNQYISSVLKNILQPKRDEIFDFCHVADLCCIPQFKFLQAASNPFLQDGLIKCVPTTEKSEWTGNVDSCQELLPSLPLNNQSKQMIFKLQEENGDRKRKQKSLAHQTIFAKAYLKQPGATQQFQSSDYINQQTLKRIVHKHRPVDWNSYQIEDSASLHCFDEAPFPSKLQGTKSYGGSSKDDKKLLGSLSGDGKQLINNKRSCTLITNCTTISDPMLKVLNIAEGKLRHKAYLHWYTKYGMEEDELW